MQAVAPLPFTKALLAKALGAFATSGSLNNHLGVPLSLALTPKDVSAAVYEIGTSHPGEIAPLAKLVQPDVAIVLNVHPAHAEYFVDLDTHKRLLLEALRAYNWIATSETPQSEEIELFAPRNWGVFHFRPPSPPARRCNQGSLDG